MKKKLFLSAACCIVTFNLSSQRATNEKPFGLRDDFRGAPLEVIALSAPDMDRIEKEDLVNDSRPGPLRYAYPVRVDYNPENSGVWQQLDDGSKLWRLKVNIPGALATVTYYDKFWLPEGSKFFVYSEETQQSIGAIISDHIDGSREKPIRFATSLIYGDNVVYEYYQPNTVVEPPILSIYRIDYGYRYVNNLFNKERTFFGDSNPCNINVNCPEGDNWNNEKRAVAKISVPSVFGEGSGWCSCALINNTTNDYTPYVLTADHCLYGIKDAINDYTIDEFVFYWHYEHAGCANSSVEPIWRSSSGATVVANNSISDFALLKIKSTQDPRYIVGVYPYYLGWDRSGSAGSSGAGIHHPAGDVKKISLTNLIQNNPNSIYWSGGAVSPPNVHWIATFYNGFIEGGSSGSPLINNNRKVIGQLHGGYAASCITNYDKFYGKFDVSWTGNGALDNRRRLNTWLDPIGSNPTTLNGMGVSAPYLSGPDYLCIGTNSSFSITNVPSGFTWNCSSNITLVSSSGNSAVFTGNATGAGWISLFYSGVECFRKNLGVYTCRSGSSSNDENTESSFIAYPNPISSSITVDFSIPDSYTIRIFDNHGNMLYETASDGSSIHVNASSYPPGYYFLHVKSGSSSSWEVQKLQKN